MRSETQSQFCEEEKGLETKEKLFCTKIAYFRPRAKPTDANHASDRGGLRGRAFRCWAIFVILRQK